MRIDNLTIRLDNEKQRSEQLEEKVTQIAKSYIQILNISIYDKLHQNKFFRCGPSVETGNKFGRGQPDH